MKNNFLSNAGWVKPVLSLSNGRSAPINKWGGWGIAFINILLIVAFFCGNHIIHAADMTARLSGDTSSYGFSIVNNSGTTTARFRGDGNVGIGTTTPSSRLMIVGSSTSSNDASLIIRTGSANDVVYARNDGKVGIGTNTPSTALHVIGTVTATQGFSGDGSQLTGISASSVGANSVSSSSITDGSITGSDLASTLTMTSQTMNIGSITVNAGNFRVDSAGSMTATTITSTGSVTASAITTTGTLTASGNLNIDSGTLFVDSANNRVGVGTTTPQSALAVNGTVTVTNGYVGIGTTTPNVKLEVVGIGYFGTFLSDYTNLGNSQLTVTASSPATFGMIVNSATASEYSRFIFGGRSTDSITKALGSVEGLIESAGTDSTIDGAVRIATTLDGTNAEKVRITSTGNVGIGTTTPSTKLQVVGTVTATYFSGNGSGLTGISASVGTNSVSSASITDGSVASADIADGTIAGADLATNISISTTGTMSVASGNFVVDSAGSMTAKVITATGSVTASAITTTGTLTASGNLNIDSGTLFVDSANNKIGIGTSSPAALLHVLNNQNAETSIKIENTSNSALAAASLIVNGVSSRAVRILAVPPASTDAGFTLFAGGSVIQANPPGFTNHLWLNTMDSGSDIIFVPGGYAASDEAMRVSNTGRVGIGTTTPSTALVVVGTVTATSFSGNGSGLTGISASSVSSDSVSSSSIVDGSITGSDLASTLSMSSKALDIGSITVNAGNLRVDSAGSMTATTITSTGSVTASAITTTGTLTASGNLNIDSGTLFVDSANNRVGVGTTTPQSALAVVGTVTISGNKLITWANDTTNTFLGIGAGGTSTTGSYNAANGYRALYSNTTGYGNAANGYRTLYSNTTGYRNAAYGMSALYSNSTGTLNTANGYTALYSNTSGTENTANGAESLYSNSTGYGNTANGYYALYFNDTGYGNTAQGGYALQGNSTGIYNTANGYRALYSNFSGNNNTAVGYDAGYNTTGTGSVFLGYQAGYNETGSNKLHIANSSSSTLIYGDFSTTRVGIGTTTPSTTLVVNGTLTATYFSGNGSGLTGISASPGADSVSSSSIVDGSITGSDLASSISISTTGTMSVANGGFVVDSAGSMTASSISATGTLTVSGCRIVTFAGTATNTYLGVDAGSSTSTGSNNTAYGYKALALNTTGTSCTALGAEAMRSNTTGYWNVAVGSFALSSNTTGKCNIAMGDSALQSNTTGNWNTAIGDGAMYSNTTGTSSVAIGSEALYYNTTGYQNTAVGVGSLNNNTTGSNNVALGGYAMNSNTTGYGNTAVGDTSLFTNTTGNRNTAVGDGALYYNSTGTSSTALGFYALYNNIASRNTAMGDYALYSNTTGEFNSAVGVTALTYNTTGISNVAFGDSALYANTTGSYNTAIGYYTLGTNTTGIYNTAVGISALYNNTAGGYNTAVGVQAGFNASGTASVFIGYNAGANETDSNKLHIANSSSSTLIYGDFSSYKVSIGTTTPVAMFTVGSGTPTIITSPGTGTVFITSNLEVGGNPYNANASWIAPSDKRLKKHINPLTGALDKIVRLQGVTYEWLHPENHGNLSGTQTGLIAQEVEDIFPEWVDAVDATGRDRELVPEGEKVKTLKFPHGFNAYVIEAIKELKVENDVLKSENETLRARLTALEETVGAYSNTTVQCVDRVR